MVVRTTTRAWTLFIVVLACALGAVAQAQGVPPRGEVAALYRELRSVPLDSARVYGIRDAVLDREDLHIYLTDGTIGFTRSVDGRVTGAYFDGEGEVLVRPPNRAERASLGLFTGAGLLNEHFATAYFRFNDDTFQELQPYLRDTDDAADFFAKNEEGSRNLAEMDALRLLCSMTSKFPATQEPKDRFLHARVGGVQLGAFDLFYDTLNEEQITIGNFTQQQSAVYYDVWMSFPGRSVRLAKDAEQRITDPWRSPYSVAITRFNIASRLLPPETIEGEAVLDMEVRHGGQRLLMFELSRYLHLQKVTLGTRELEFLQNESVNGTELARKGNDLVVAILPEPLRDGERLQLKFVYSGSVMSQAGVGLLYVGARGTWFPNRGPAMAQFELNFRWPEQWTLVATGKRVALNKDGADLVGRWVSEVPMPLAGFNLGQYTKKSVMAGNVVVESYAASTVERAIQSRPVERRIIRPGADLNARDETIEVAPPAINPSLRSESVAESCARAIHAYTEWFGPYPYSSLALTQFPSGDSQGWPGLVFLSSVAFLTPEEKARLKLDDFARVLYADLMPWHETAHMWWGDVVFWRSYRDQWLVEALSNYSALLLLEREHPGDFQVAMDRYRAELLKKSPNGKQYLEAGPVNLGARLASSRFPEGYASITYGRGTWLLYMLHQMLRDGRPAAAPGVTQDDPFLRGLRLLRERYAYKEVTTADLQKVFEEVMPPGLRFEGRKSLDWFFDGWVSGTAIPAYSLDEVKLTPREGKLVATFTVLQKEAPRDLVTPVPIYAVTADKQVFVGRVFADGEQTRARLTVPAGTRKLVVDPNQTLLRRP